VQQVVTIVAASRVELHGTTTLPLQLAMFAPSFARAVRSSASAPLSPAGPLCRAVFTTAPTPFHPLHQRRYSSSKSSVPPSSKKKELERNAAIQLSGQEPGAKPEDKVMEGPRASSTHNIPHVPATTHRHRNGKM
jgi:hypothetical protein